MSKKTKTPKFNSVLEDFRKFAGLKVAEEQGDKEQSVSYIPSEEDVKKQLPNGGKPFGSNTDPNANKGTAQGEKAPDTKEPTTEEQTTKETSPSSKVASEDEELVNSLLSSISLVVNEEKVASEAVKEETKQEGKEVPVSANPEVPCEDKKAEEAPKEEAPKEEAPKEEAPKVASADEINEDALASKIASHFRNTSVGYELGKFLFQTLGQKVAEGEEIPAEGGVPPEVAAGMEAGGAPVEGGGEEDEIAVILQAVQELVEEGQITEDQAQQFLVELQSAVQGGGGAPEGGAPAPEAPASEEEAPKEEAPEEEAPEEAKEAMIAAVNAKVAELVAEGKTDSQIEEYIKEAAANDAEMIVQNSQQEVFNQYVYDKVASAIDQGATQDQVDEYIKSAQENPQEVVEEINSVMQLEQAINNKVAELQSEGKTEQEIEEYLKQAAINDANSLKQEEVKQAILGKVAQARKTAEEVPMEAAPGPEGAGAPAPGGEEIPPEIQQILQALEQLLQSGQITEEEAMAVLQELGIGGGEGAAPEGAGAPPEAAAMPPEGAVA